MQAIRVLFFASLKERLKKERIDLESTIPLSVLAVWQRSSGEMVVPGNVLVSVNQEYTHLEALVQPGDEVAFFPPVTGG